MNQNCEDSVNGYLLSACRSTPVCRVGFQFFSLHDPLGFSSVSPGPKVGRLLIHLLENRPFREDVSFTIISMFHINGGRKVIFSGCFQRIGFLKVLQRLSDGHPSILTTGILSRCVVFFLPVTLLHDYTTPNIFKSCKKNSH